MTCTWHLGVFEQTCYVTKHVLVHYKRGIHNLPSHMHQQYPKLTILNARFIYYTPPVS